MGGYSQQPWSEDVPGITQPPQQRLPRLLAAILGADDGSASTPQPPYSTPPMVPTSQQQPSRIDDDPQTRSAPPSTRSASPGGETLGIPNSLPRGGATPMPGAAAQPVQPYGQSPQGRQSLVDELRAQYEKLNTPAPPPTLKDRILRGLSQVAVPAAAAIAGKGYGLTGALEGENAANTQQYNRQQVKEAQRQGKSDRLLQELTAYDRLQQQEDLATQREKMLQDRQNATFTQQQDLQSQRLRQQQDAIDQRTQQQQDSADAKERANQISKQQADTLNANYNKLATTHGLPPNQFSEGMTRQEASQLSSSLNSVVSKQQGDTRISMEGPKQLAIQPDGTVVELRPGSKVTPGTTTLAGEVASNKLGVGGQKAIDYANDYLDKKVYTGPGDEALMDQFFSLSKPDSGFRMSQPQLQMLRNSQSWMNSMSAKLRHATTGTWFSDEQRQQIVDTMKQLQQSSTQARQPQPAQQPTQKPKQKPGGSLKQQITDPLGILQ